MLAAPQSDNFKRLSLRQTHPDAHIAHRLVHAFTVELYDAVAALDPQRLQGSVVAHTLQAKRCRVAQDLPMASPPSTQNLWFVLDPRFERPKIHLRLNPISVA